MPTGFRRIIAVLCLLAGCALCPGPARAEAEERAVHVFCNSLFHHVTDSPDTAVHWWLAELARACGKAFAASGQWGFLRDFARDGVADRWSLDGVARPRGPVETVILTPTNFIQYQPPDRPFDGENPDRATPLGTALAAIDAARARWHSYSLSDYHDWLRSFTAALQEARPDAEIAILPVFSVLPGLQTRLLEDARALEAFILTDQSAGAAHLRGRYLLRYEGEGVLRVTGRVDNVRYDHDRREIRFDTGPGKGPVVLQLTRTDPAPLRNITLLHEDHVALHAAGARAGQCERPRLG